MTMNKFHFNEHKQDTWKCDWLIGHIISIKNGKGEASRMRIGHGAGGRYNKSRSKEGALRARAQKREKKGHVVSRSQNSRSRKTGTRRRKLRGREKEYA